MQNTELLASLSKEKQKKLAAASKSDLAEAALDSLTINDGSGRGTF